MKRLFRLALCTGLIAALLSIPAFAAEGDAPEVQGDFSVLVNGEYLTFADAAPELRDNRSCLPFVAVFDALGFAEEDMTWDAATKTVTAVKPDVTYDPLVGTEPQVGDLTVELTVGSPQISYWYEYDLNSDEQGAPVQVVHTYETDVAPYIANNRTYIPFGLVADALGYQVGWDSQTRAVIIDDVDAILAANTETYTLMDQYLAYNRTFTEGNQKVTGGYTMNMDMTMGTPELTTGTVFDLSGDYDMITANNTALEFSTQMTLDCTSTVNGMVAELEDGTGQVLFPMTVDFDMRGDMAEGSLYFNLASDDLAALTGWGSDVWYKFDMKALFDETASLTGMNYEQLMALSNASLDATFAESLEMLLRTTPLTSAQFTTSDALALYNSMFADSSFEKSGSSYVNTLLDVEGVSGTFTLYTSGNKVNGYAMELTVQDAATGAALDMAASMRGSKLEMTMSMSQTVYGTVTNAEGETEENASLMEMSLSFTMDGTYQSTTRCPETEPPVGATWVDLLENAAGGSAGGSAGEFDA